MADIGKLEKRVTQIEKNLSLSLVEKSISDKIIPSSTDPAKNRFKNAFLVDGFKNVDTNDSTNLENRCFIDTAAGKLLPLTFSYNVEGMFDRTDPSTSNNIHEGKILMLPFEELPIIQQLTASQPAVPKVIVYPTTTSTPNNVVQATAVQTTANNTVTPVVVTVANTVANTVITNPPPTSSWVGGGIMITHPTYFGITAVISPFLPDPPCYDFTTGFVGSDTCFLRRSEIPDEIGRSGGLIDETDPWGDLGPTQDDGGDWFDTIIEDSAVGDSFYDQIGTGNDGFYDTSEFDFTNVG